MIKNLIIIGLIVALYTGVSSEQLIDMTAVALDNAKDLVYSMKESVK